MNQAECGKPAGAEICGAFDSGMEDIPITKFAEEKHYAVSLGRYQIERTAFVGIVHVLYMTQVDKLTPNDWYKRHGIPDYLINAQFANTIKPVPVAILNRSTLKQFAEPVEVPDGEKAPRGVNWIHPTHLAKLTIKVTGQVGE